MKLTTSLPFCCRRSPYLHGKCTTGHFDLWTPTLKPRSLSQRKSSSWVELRSLTLLLVAVSWLIGFLLADAGEPPAIAFDAASVVVAALRLPLHWDRPAMPRDAARPESFAGDHDGEGGSLDSTQRVVTLIFNVKFAAVSFLEETGYRWSDARDAKHALRRADASAILVLFPL